MMLSTGRRLLPLVLGLIVASAGVATARMAGAQPPSPSARPAAAPRPRPSRWWKDDQFKKDLGLTSDQSARIDTIYQTTLPQLRRAYDELDRLETKLSHLIEKDVDEEVILQQ